VRYPGLAVPGKELKADRIPPKGRGYRRIALGAGRFLSKERAPSGGRPGHGRSANRRL